MLNKKSILLAIENLPEEFHLDDLIDQLLIYAKIEKGLNDIDEGNVLSQSELEKLIETW